MNPQSGSVELDEVRFVKRVHVGSVNPNNPVSEEQQEKQIALLNRCLNDFPRGCIIGRDIAVGVFQIGEHRITLQRTTYHVGFPRKPLWLDEETHNG
jgi:hypothetical protein